MDWDDILPLQLSEKWSNFLQHLQELNIISFQRWFGKTSLSSIKVHCFCDASQHAPAAAIYIKSSEQNGEIKTGLVCSKTKVAPIKRLTIARLELSAAVLGTKLTDYFLKVLNLENGSVHLWTDSAITYTWINNHPSRWKEFVHNRVCLIQETIPSAKWHFIPGKENPADFATRGLTPAQLAQSSNWWSDPEWLQHHSESWPKQPEISLKKTDMEERPVAKNVANIESSCASWDLLLRYSKLSKLLTITALCRRFILQLNKKANSIVETSISPKELEEAKIFLLKITQQTGFNKEIKHLQKEEALPTTHHLARLTPFLDSQDLIRLGGRLKESSLSYNIKHPLILPKDSPFTQLVILNAHQRTLHGGTQKTLSFIRQEFWIIGGRVPVSSLIWKCVKCAIYRKLRAEQLMGQLPAERVTPSRPFLYSGVDYAGPLHLKTWKGRNARTYKAYISLFVCHSTLAIHLELVTDCTSDAFIAAYKRFTARRGICATLRSDCGNNLKGADSQLKELFSSASKELGNLSSLLAKDGT